MAKRWSANSLVAQVLLICLVGTNVEVLGQKGAQFSQGSTPVRESAQPGLQPTSTHYTAGWPSYPGQNPQTNVQPVVKPSYPGQNPQTNIQPGSKQTSTKYVPKVQPGGKPSYPGQNPQTNVQPGGKPSYPGQNPHTNVQPGSQSSYTQYRQPTSSQQTSPPKPSQYSQIFQDRPFQNPYDPPPQKPHQPKPPQLPPQVYQPPQAHRPPQAHQPPSRPKVPETPGELFCDVEESVKITCGSHDISAAGCEAINCCFDGRHCFFGKAVTVLCTKDGQFVVVVAKDATLPNLDIETISLFREGQGCSYVDSNSAFAIFQFPVTACGSFVTEEPGVIIYENRMSSSYELQVGPNGIITRDSSFDLLFQCRYTGTSIETLIIEVLPLQDPPLPVAALGPIRVQLRLANGECLSKGCNEFEAAYTSFYTEADYPVTKVLRDRVFVEVQLLEKTDPNLVLTLGHCWTTTGPNPHSLPQWDLLIDGCPYRDDRYMSSLVPIGPSSGLAFPGHYRRFIFKMFTFVDSSSLQALREQVYIHCSTAVCTPGGGRSCEPSCFRKKRETGATPHTGNEPKVVITVGPVTMVDDQSPKSV